METFMEEAHKATIKAKMALEHKILDVPFIHNLLLRTAWNTC